MYKEKSSWDAEDMEMMERPLPSNPEAEGVILGIIMLDNARLETAADVLVPEDFYVHLHKQVYRAMLEISGEGTNIDPISISENIKARGEKLDSVSEITNLTRGASEYPFSSIAEKVKVIKTHSVARRALMLSNLLIKELWLGTEDVPELLDEYETKLMTLNSEVQAGTKQEADKPFQSLAEVSPLMLEQFVRYHAGERTGVGTGMPEVDEALDGGGLQPGGTYLIAATEKTGKTSLALDWAYDIAEIQKESPVPIITMEMTKLTLAKRIFSAHTGIPYARFRPGFYDGVDKSYTRAITALDDFGNIPIWIADSLYNWGQISRYIRRIVEQSRKPGKQPIKVVVIDYLQLIGWDEKTANREREVTAISRAVKMLAMELGIAIIIISNLNRQGLSEGQEPDTFNLRDSGSLAFDAEAIFFLHNPAYVPGKPYEYRPVTDINLILSRQRNGPTGRWPLKLVGAYMQFMTIKQYERHFGDISTDKQIPQSVGQKRAEVTAIKNNWGDDDE